MAYVAMNIISADLNIFTAFLNGVSRHERTSVEQLDSDQFLNGVCRHELGIRFDLLLV